MWSLCCIYSLGHLLAKVSAAPTELNSTHFSMHILYNVDALALEIQALYELIGEKVIPLQKV